jgi:hypothetical protein
MYTRRGFVGLISKCAAAVGIAAVVRSAVADAPKRSAERKGIPGKTYFRAPDVAPPDGARVYLNGEDVTVRSYECDLEAGWVRAFYVERDPGGGKDRIIIGSEHYEFGQVQLIRDGRIVKIHP